MRSTAFAGMVLCAIAAAASIGCGAGGGASSAVAPNPQPSPTLAPSPTPSPTPMQLVIGTTVGTDTFPEGDTSTGGHGQQIDGIDCKGALDNQFHHHVHLSMFVNGEQIALPRGTGMKQPGHNKFVYHAKCVYYVHTHDETGIIHIEPPDGRAFTLAQYFDLWGEPLSTNGFAGYSGSVSVYIDGVLQPGMDPTTIAFSPFEEITLVIGTPPSWIPAYVFPPGYP
ncbi:MAG TPA: hypothetical protein VFO25_13010 [Candidatus Eremiobacteraceae bacterium]|nr:hypothetical protein [Candidatus Eremiobacteraceae bacterium]